MKKNFTTLDVLTVVEELKNLVIGLRVNQIYDIDHKTYLLKLQKPDQKVVLLLESASRLHTTEYEWPKSPAPSGFSMKLRKHLRNKRIENIEQLGVDRIVDLTFGSGEACHHLIVELYDRGNIVLTDGEYNILNVLRPRKDAQDARIAVNEKYNVKGARKVRDPPDLDAVKKCFNDAKDNLLLKKLFNPLLDCGGSVLEHELINSGFGIGAKKNSEIDLRKVSQAVQNAQKTAVSRNNRENQGFIIKKEIQRTNKDGNLESSFVFEEFHPELYNQHKHLPYDELPSFNKACDEFFANLEAHEVDKKTAQKEKEALKKLENVRRDHQKRIKELKGKQEVDASKGQMIELNHELVEKALLTVRSAIANQIDWSQIEELLEEARSRSDPTAVSIRALKLKSNMLTMWLADPFNYDENDMLLDSDEEREEGNDNEKMRPVAVDINLDLSALANARKYYDMKRMAAKKEQKTIDASVKAIKSAEKKTLQTLKEVSAIANINKARKVHWFEKFLWFISSENYLVLGGHDGQQNELLVKRHLGDKDIYVHADLHGASTVVIKNATGENVPPKTLHEAGIMALCNSRAWEQKVVTSAWWVWGHQVSKSAPSGEYLTTGSFMVRGKKNFLPPSHLVYGFGFMFRLEESSVYRHANERKVKTQELEENVNLNGNNGENDCDNEVELDDDKELNLSDNEIDLSDDKELYDSDKEVSLDDHKEPSDSEDDTGSNDNSKEIDINNDKKPNPSDNEQNLNDNKELNSNDNKENSNNSIDTNKESINNLDVSDCKFEDKAFMRSRKCDKSAVNKLKSDIPEFKGINLSSNNVPESSVTVSSKSESSTKDSIIDNTLIVNDRNNTVDFPDTELKISHLKGAQFTLRTQQPLKDKKVRFDENNKSIRHENIQNDAENIDKNKNKNRNNEDKTINKFSKENDENIKNKKEPIKRGQKGKLKKMQKYKEQDDEDREIMMQILQSSGPKKLSKKEQRKKKNVVKAKRPMQNVNKFKEGQENRTELNDAITEVDEENVQLPDDLSILESLTAIPLMEDELLYAIPVCAPYASMTNFKFKVKLTPGTGKKGKACKTAINLFMSDRSAATRERDLLRAIKDHDLTKNFPGKVKVSAPNISKVKKS